MLASFALRAALLRLMSATAPSSTTGGPRPHRSGNKHCQHEHRGCFGHCRTTIEPAWTSNSSVAFNDVGGSDSEPRTAPITLLTWLSASAAVASSVARSATPTVSRSCAATAGHAASRSLRCRSAHPKQLVNVGSSTDASAAVASECDSPVNDVEDSDTSNRADSGCSAAAGGRGEAGHPAQDPRCPPGHRGHGAVRAAHRGARPGGGR